MITYKAVYELSGRFVKDPKPEDKAMLREVVARAKAHLSTFAVEVLVDKVITDFSDDPSPICRPMGWKPKPKVLQLSATIQEPGRQLNLCVLTHTRQIYNNIPFGFELAEIEATFTDARLAACYFTSSRKGPYVTGTNGSTYRGSSVYVKCDPDAHLVVVRCPRHNSTPSLDWTWRFQPTCLEIVWTLNATEAARRLAIAVRSGNRNQTKRLKNKMFEAIGFFVSPSW